MRMEVTLRQNQDVEVDVDFDDFMEQCFSRRGDEKKEEKISAIAGLLKRIPDSAITELTEAQRGVVGNFLKLQADRYLLLNSHPITTENQNHEA